MRGTLNVWPVLTPPDGYITDMEKNENTASTIRAGAYNHQATIHTTFTEKDRSPSVAQKM
jgi:hypothetical protein